MRQKLLEWFPILGPCHRRWSAGVEFARRGAAALRSAFMRFRFNVVWEAKIRRAARQKPRPALRKPVIHLYAVCWNEEQIIPYFMEHYGSTVDQFIIFDNGSTDSTLKLLSHYKNVEIIPFATGGKFDDGTHMRIKNSAWKSSAGKADYVIVCDMDEFLYHSHLDVVLALMKKHGFTVLMPHGYQMVGEHLPAFDGKHLVTDLHTTGVEDVRNYSKTILFDPNQVEINFRPGCHRSYPTGKVKMFRSDYVKLLHYKFVDRQAVLRKTRIYREKLSEMNLEKGWSRHYQKTDAEIMAVFDQMMAAARKVI